MIDCHNHILPAIDDGAIDTTMSLEMARVALSNGIESIIVTPHHQNGAFFNNRESILASVAEFKKLLATHNLPLKVYPGAENHLTPEIFKGIANGSILTYADQGKAILIELPKHSLATGTENLLRQVLSLNTTPIVAHPERNSRLRRSLSIVEQWASWGCQFQLTAQSVSGEFGSEIQSFCKQICQRGFVQLVASDAHRPTGRAPNLSPAYTQLVTWIGTDGANLLIRDNLKTSSKEIG